MPEEYLPLLRRGQIVDAFASAHGQVSSDLIFIV
jgi:hypothetical protein